jgi:DMSO/TMAO reductase YedYZ molybdopterin-dependent catalytic subunit
MGVSKSYTERKEAWAAKMRARGARALAVRSRDRLPPGQHVVQQLPVLDLGVHPQIPRESWKLEIDGLVENPITLDWPALLALPQNECVSDFHCVTTWSRYDCRWLGVSFGTLLDLVRPSEEARFAFFTAYDSYTTNTPIEPLTDPDALLAHTLDGVPLSVEHGGPLRAILPQLYAWKGAKWISRIEFRASDCPGYWEQRGYSNTADPWSNDRFMTGI